MGGNKRREAPSAVEANTPESLPLSFDFCLNIPSITREFLAHRNLHNKLLVAFEPKQDLLVTVCPQRFLNKEGGGLELSFQFYSPDLEVCLPVGLKEHCSNLLSYSLR